MKALVMALPLLAGCSLFGPSVAQERARVEAQWATYAACDAAVKAGKIQLKDAMAQTITPTGVVIVNYCGVQGGVDLGPLLTGTAVKLGVQQAAQQMLTQHPGGSITVTITGGGDAKKQ